MSSILSSFMKDVNSISSPKKISEVIKDDDDDNEIEGGTLLISGCIDWDRSIGYKGNDSICLNEPMILKFNQPVLKSFSSSSSFHLFIQLLDGKIYGLGRNTNGQLGCKSLITQTYPILIKIPESNRKVIKIATGSRHSLMLLDNGNVYSCGSNELGACGLGSNKSVIKDITEFTKIVALQNIVDIACGSDFSLVVDHNGTMYSFGHPETGQLGLGSNGEFIAKAGKINYSYVYEPTEIKKFCQKVQVFGSKPKIVELSEKIKIVKVACGKNHCIALEDWENLQTRGNRVFSWGSGGYGRNGLGNQDDELIPTEISTLSDNENKNITKHIREISAGSTFSIAISRTRNLYYMGKMSNSPRGEATMIPKMMNELVGYPVRCADSGYNCIFVGTSDLCIGWGVAVAGKFGFQDDTKGSTVPTLVAKVNGLYASNISCGQYHTALVVTDKKLPAVDTGGHSSYCQTSQGSKVKIEDIPIWLDTTITTTATQNKRKNDDNKNDDKKKKSKK